MSIHNIEEYIKDYLYECGQPESDWDIEAWAEDADDYMQSYGYGNPDMIDVDVWSDMAQRHDVSGR